MRISRRALLGGAGLGLVAAGATGCGVDLSDLGAERPSCAPRSALDGHDDLAGAPLIYEVDERGRTFAFDGPFYERLLDWLGFFRSVAGVEVTEIRTYGSWTDGGVRCGSWHNAGRAFDLARLRAGGRDLVSCRYDEWGSAADRRGALRRYWATAAALHHHFADVLTYLFDDVHQNHIHVDNGRTGTELSTFRDGASRVQNHAVQAICTHVWERPVPIDGTWADPTRAAVAAVADEIGSAGDLTDPEAWRAFLTASAARFDS